jgi:YgiT-type zinc finger domain-containing protein
MKRAAPRKRQPPQNTPCDACGGRSFKRKTTTFPFPLPTGQTMNVAGVQVQECLTCHALTPTDQGRLKLARCVGMFISLPDKI